MRIALATCAVLPDPDPDQAPLAAELRAGGHEVTTPVWDDPQVRWGDLDVCVLRSTWDYTERPGEFLAWVDRVASQTVLLNPAPVVRWNAHKRYLLELAAAGVPVVPTELAPAGGAPDLGALCAARGWDDVVIKPAVSAGSRDTLRARAGDAAGAAHLAALVGRGDDALVQPYQASVEGPGERALVAIGGELSHAVRKSPRFLGDGEQTRAAPIEADEAALAEALLAGPARGLLYARIDLVRDAAGRPQVAELELIEPSLFFATHPPALARFAAALPRWVEEARACSS
ncbi:MAG: RimK family alpha-L-glutamate ligase [Planctomycetota bacterium]